MPDLLTPTFLTALIGAGLLSAVPLLFAGLGETIAHLFAERGCSGMVIEMAFPKGQWLSASGVR